MVQTWGEDMPREISSKNIDGIADLVVIAPVKEGFINAYENVTYATRLRLVAEALNRIRVSAREHESRVPFSDVTERILTLLDFRIGVLDKDMFSLEKPRNGEAFELRSRRYLYLTATFDTAWEPYMRLIWDPLGPFLDLIFCNCEGYVTAGDNSCEAFLDWVARHQMDSAIFYATTGSTIRDDIYHGKIDRLLREVNVPDRELEILRTTMPNPEVEAADVRAEALRLASKGKREKLFKLNELALEVLTVLFRLADYYPPEWLFTPGTATPAVALSEGKYLARVAHSILDGWDDSKVQPPLSDAFIEPLLWYRQARVSAVNHKAPCELDRPTAGDPAFDLSQVPGGILVPPGNPERPVLHGALLLLTISDTEKARAFLARFPVNYQSDDAAVPADGFFRTLAFTAEGLKRIGLKRETLDDFPKEFREGMAARSGLVGDLRENHPRRWAPPRRNWPPEGDGYRPAVDSSEIDLVIQLRHAPDGPAETAVLTAEIARIAHEAAGHGLWLVAYEPMQRQPDIEDPAKFVDHFGFTDGVSQPEVQKTEPDTLFESRTGEQKIWNNKVRLGDILLGYRNERGDFPLVEQRRYPASEMTMSELTFNGTFLVVRKLQQHRARFDAVMEREAARLRSEGFHISAEELAWQIIGRKRDGTPLVSGATGQNGFDYEGDPQGSQCPLAAHARRTNPRNFEHGRPAPRILRRGMSYGPAHDPGEDADSAAERGLIFMCYQSSISEQFEVIQRWINGGNSTDVSSAQNDPLLGVGPKQGPRLFQFEWQERVARVEFNEAFVSLHWGLYLFVPSRSGLAELTRPREEEEIEGIIPDLAEFRENTGRRLIDRTAGLPPDVASLEWKRLLEDLDAKDPAELSLTPDVWSAIRWYGGGSYRLPTAANVAMVDDGSHAYRIAAGLKLRPTVIVASADHVEHVLANWKTYSVEEQLHRLEGTSGSIYVSQQPDDRYVEHDDLNGKYNYRAESDATNRILMAHDMEAGFKVGHGAGSALLKLARQRASQVPVQPPLDYFKLELRRQYIMPVLGLVCSSWFGIPGTPVGDDPDNLRAIMENGGWDWRTATNPADPEGASLRPARCPGDCLSPSRHAFYPRPTDSIAAYALDHGPAIRKAGEAFVDKYFGKAVPPGSVSGPMFEAIKERDVLARNLIGIMMGAMPPMDGNLRGILAEWLNEKTLWRHQAAYLRKRAEGLTPYAAAHEALWIPMTRAMCKRPAPDLLYRIAIKGETLKAQGYRTAQDTEVRKGDLVIVSQVGAAQQSLFRNPYGAGKVSAVFGGEREASSQGYYDGDTVLDSKHPVHACPGMEMAMGAMMGILAALFEAGRIQALPASLIIKVMDWPLSPA
jgi:Dyp-type peroxidase family